MRFHFHQRSSGDTQMAQELLGVFPPLSLGDVCWDRRRCPTNLAGQTEQLLFGECSRGLIALLRQFHGKLPYFQLAVTLHFHFLSPPSTLHPPPLLDRSV